MEAKTIKISPLNYRRICEYAGELQHEIGEPVSIDRTITILLQKNKVSDLSGSWNMSEKEASDIMTSLKRGWKKWKIASV